MAALNLPKTTISQVKKNLIQYYARAIRKGDDLRNLRSVCLWSVPGVGKSQMVRQVTEELAHETGLPFEFREVRLSDCTIFELLGLMRQNPSTNQVEYIRPPIYLEPKKHTYLVYLFDELDKASQQLQAAALHLILDKCFWQFELPENSIVIAAGNPENIDGELFSRFRPELNNRFRHYLIEADFSCWRDWAVRHQVNPFVLEFLEANNGMIYAEDAGEENTAFSSPRSWMAVSDYLNLMAEEEELRWEELYLDICGDIGQTAALALKAFCEAKGGIPPMEAVFSGKVRKVPVKSDQKHAVSSSMLCYIWEHRESMTQEKWSSGCAYINLFPEDYAAAFYRNVLALDMDRSLLLKTPEFQFWKRKHGRYL